MQAAAVVMLLLLLLLPCAATVLLWCLCCLPVLCCCCCCVAALWNPAGGLDVAAGSSKVVAAAAHVLLLPFARLSVCLSVCLFAVSLSWCCCVTAADLVPAKVKMYIFYGMPKKTKLKTIFAPLCGQSPEQVMAPAVADSHKLGYDKLYRLLLDHVSTAVALLLLLTG